MTRRSVRLTATMLTIMATLLLTVSVHPAAAQSGPRPGTTDPIGQPSNYELFRDDDVYFPQVTDSCNPTCQPTVYPDAYPVDTNLNFGNPIASYVANLSTALDPQVWSASGRIRTAASDDAITMVRAGATSGQVALYFTAQGPSFDATYSTSISNLADRAYTSDLIDLGVGDLDKLADSSGNYHDEVAVAYASGSFDAGYQVNLTVLNYTSECSGPNTTIAPCGVTTVQTSHSIAPFNDTTTANWAFPGQQDNIIATAVGDFDGNGVAEVAVAYLQNASTLWVSTFRYTGDGKGSGTLEEVSSASFTGQQSFFQGSITLEAGDFDGSNANADELVLGHVENRPFACPGENLLGYASTIALNNALAMTQVDVANVVDTCDTSDSPLLMRMQVEPGLFRFDPATGYDFGRRQFAVAYNDPDGTLAIKAFTVGPALEIAHLWGPAYPLQTARPGTGPRFSIAAGGYRGVQDASNPVWALAYYGNSATADAAGNHGTIGMLDGATGTPSQNLSVGDNQSWPNLRVQLAAYDYSGASIYLGAPVHYTVDGAVNTDFVLQEPPKHAYYDNNPQSSTYGQVVTVSRKDGFNVSLQDSTNTTFTSKSTDTVSSNIGRSFGGSASATVGVNEDFGIAKVSASVTASFSQTASYTDKQTAASYNGQYASRSVSFTGATNRDDYLSGRLQTIDIWRYRVFGLAIPASGGAQPNGFYDIVLPGPVEPFAGGGSSFDWYQPLHENGNILSYPGSLGADNLPADLGVYTDTTGTLQQQPLVPASLQAFDGTSGSVALQYGSTSGSGYIESYSHSQKSSTDVAVSAKVSAEAFGVSGTVNTSVKAQWSNETSSSSSNTSSQTTGTSTGITLNKSDGNVNQGYLFTPVFYITQDGTVKTAHSANVLGSATGQPFWASLYGAKADPALNLPNRFNPVLEENVLVGWQPDTGTSADRNSIRKQLRGFALQEATINPVTGRYDLLAYAPAAGDKVRVATNVYNYSTGVAVSNLLVQMEAIPYDAADDVETPFTSCPNGLQLTARGRCVIGQTTVASLGVAGATNVAPAAITWNTAGFGPGTASPSGQYRIYTVLDPNNTIPEIYETENPTTVYPWVTSAGTSKVLPRGVDPGQNNEGYGLATVAPAGTSLENVQAADVFLRAGSLAALDARTLRPTSDAAQVTAGQTARVRLTLSSDREQREFNDVLIYDGDPSTGGVLIAQKRVFAGNPDGTSVWFSWLPATAGTHTLYAKVLNDHDDPNVTNGVDTLTVIVGPPHYRTFAPLMVNRARVQ